MEPVVVQFVADTSRMKPAVDQLEQLNAVEKGIAEQFKKTNAEFQKQEQLAQQAGNATSTSVNNTKKSIADLNTAVNNVSNTFSQKFNQEVNKALQQAGVNVDALNADIQRLKQSGAVIDGLEAKVGELTAQVVNLERANEASGKQYEELLQQFKDTQAQLTQLQAAFDALKEKQDGAGDSSNTLKQRLREITVELTRMKVAGEDATNPERYRQLTEEAGNIKDAFADVNEEIGRAGSDTGALDSLLAIGGGVTGAFTAAQGAIGLFSKENEKLQEVLLRVNSALAILQGFQQVQAVLAARVAIARGLETLATTASTAALTAYNFVVGTSIGLMKAFRIAIASTGIGLLVLALIALVQWLADSADELENLNGKLEDSQKRIEANTRAIQVLGDAEVLRAENANALESEILRLRNNQLQQQRELLKFERERLLTLRSTFKTNADGYKELTNQIGELDKQINDLNTAAFNNELQRQRALREEALRNQVAITERAISLAAEGSAAQLELQQKLVRDKLKMELETTALTEAERLKIIQDANQAQLELRLAFERRKLNLEIKTIQDALKSVEAGTNAELRLRLELLRKETEAELKTTKLSADERERIRQDSINEQVRMELAFAAEMRRIQAELSASSKAEFLQLAIDRNATELALAEEGTENWLQLQIVAFELAAAEQRRQAQNNAVAIARIDAQTQQQILATRRQFFEQSAAAELAIEDAKNGSLIRGLRNLASNSRASLSDRIRAMSELYDLEAARIDKQKQDLRDMFKENLISQQEYNVRYAQLEDQRKQLSEQTAEAIAEANREAFTQTLDTVISYAGQAVDILSQIYDLQNERAQANIDAQRQQVDELLESGAITEKEAEARMKRIDQEEKRIQREQAKREKQIAIFQAIVNTAAAVTKALAAAPPPFNVVLAGISAALGAVQIGLIASRPLPQFGKGKKNKYEGWAEVGETGAELIERNGRMYIAKKRTAIWVGRNDKVYSPKETAEMLQGRDLQPVDTSGYEVNHQYNSNFDIDYDRLGKAVGENIPEVGVNIDERGFTTYMKQQQDFTIYLDKRRGFK